MTYRDLPKNPDPRMMLHCFACGANFSATRGDYFLDYDSEPHCGECLAPEPLVLVRKSVQYVPIEVPYART